EKRFDHASLAVGNQRSPALACQHRRSQVRPRPMHPCARKGSLKKRFFRVAQNSLDTHVRIVYIRFYSSGCPPPAGLWQLDSHCLGGFTSRGAVRSLATGIPSSSSNRLDLIVRWLAKHHRSVRRPSAKQPARQSPTVFSPQKNDARKMTKSSPFGAIRCS